MKKTIFIYSLVLLAGMALSAAHAWALNGTAKTLGIYEWAYSTPTNSTNNTQSYLYLDLSTTEHFLWMNCSQWNSTGSPSGVSSWNMTVYGSHDGLSFYSLGTYDIGTDSNATHWMNATGKPFRNFKIVPGHTNFNATYEYFYRGWRR